MRLILMDRNVHQRQTRINFLRHGDKLLRQKQLASIIEFLLQRIQLMEAKLFATLYHLLFSIAHPPRKRQQFSDRWIALIYLWSVLHDRPVIWACDPKNWPREMDRPLPVDSTMSRRLRTVSVLQLIDRAMAQAADLFGPPLVKTLDSKPLLVGAYSKDRDASRGRIANGMMARGYRLHSFNYGRIVREWTLDKMNAHDSVSGATLLKRDLQGAGYVVADNAYDTNDLHALAHRAGHQLIAPPRFKERHVRDAGYNNVQRLRALDVLASPLEFAGQPGRFGVNLYNRREAIESCYGELTLMGLHYLPAWARGPRRVALWTAAKILLHQCKCASRKGLMT